MPFSAASFLTAGVALTSERSARSTVAVEAAEPLRIPVFPVIAYGLTPNFVEYPGTVTLRMATMCALVTDVLDGIVGSGFRRILIVNGHGGNIPVHGAVLEWLGRNHGCRVQWHNWWNAPKTWAKVKEIDPVASHASWMENFTWTRLAGVEPPTQQKPMVDFDKVRGGNAADVRRHIGDGNFGGYYQRSEAEMAALWDVAVVETLLELV